LSARGGVCTFPRIMHYQRIQAISWLLLAAACNGGETTTLATDTDDGSSTSGDASTSGSPTSSPTTTGTPTTTETSTSTTDATSTTDETSTTTTTTTTTDTTGTSTEGSTSTTEGSSGTTDETSTTGTSTEGSTSTTEGSTSGSTGDTGGDVDNTIYEIQDGTIAEMQPVQVKGVIVTGVNPGFTAFFAQEPPGGQHSGVWVYVGQMGPDIKDLKVGDEVDIKGVTLEFDGLTEIDASTGAVTKTGQVGLPVVPEVLPIATFADPAMIEPWEGVFVRVEGDFTVSTLPGFDEFVVTDNVDDAWVDNLLYSVPLDDVNFPNFYIGSKFTAIQGPLNFSFMQYKIAPRVKEDLEGYVESPDPVIGVEELKAGDLIVTEVMYNPICANDDCEWIEVHNKTGAKIDLNGLIIQDTAMNPMQQGKVNVSAVVPAGGYAVLGYKTMATWPYANPPAAFYGSNPALGNAGDIIVLKNSKATLDSTGKWPDKGALASGVSWKLDPTKLDATSNDDPANWCYSTIVFYNMGNLNEKGSPAAVNEQACAAI
jgi:hypothetical protein